MWSYRNPVRIDFGAGGFARLPALIAGRPYALVTYCNPTKPDWLVCKLTKAGRNALA